MPAVLLAPRDLGPLEEVVARLRSALAELEDGTDDPHAVLAMLRTAGDDLDEFTGSLRRVLGG